MFEAIRRAFEYLREAPYEIMGPGDHHPQYAILKGDETVLLLHRITKFVSVSEGHYDWKSFVVAAKLCPCGKPAHFYTYAYVNLEYAKSCSKIFESYKDQSVKCSA
jgi:hypothetical protein